MLNCPSCKGPLADDFGLVDCPKCGAGLYIEFDGQVKWREEPDVGATAVANEVPAGEVAQAMEEALPDQFDFSAPAAVVAEPTAIVASGETQLFSAEIFQSDDAAEAAAPAPEAQLDFAPEEESVETTAPPMAMPAPAVAEPAVNVMQEIVDYGNSEFSSGKDGAYLYDLTIKGVDTADIRAALKELLNDKAFLWDIEDLLKRMQHGELQFSQITPVKASLVVTRLRSLPLQISWVQHALGES